MGKLQLFWISCGVSTEQQILLSTRSSSNTHKGREQNSQTSQHTQFAKFAQGNLPSKRIPSCFGGRGPKEEQQHWRLKASDAPTSRARSTGISWHLSQAATPGLSSPTQSPTFSACPTAQNSCAAETRHRITHMQM